MSFTRRLVCDMSVIVTPVVNRLFLATPWVACWFGFAWVSTPALAEPLRLVSTAQSVPILPGGNGDSTLPVFSADVRFVLFASTADNLAAATNGAPFLTSVPSWLNVYLRDRTSQLTTLVSISADGTAGNGNSLPVALSTNNQWVLFESRASNLTASDTNNASDIFLRNLAGEATLLVSVATNGTTGNAASRNASMTPDGRYITFVSEASNLVAGDSNKIADVFVRDMQLLTTTMVSIGAVATNPAQASPPAGSDSPQITPDGRFIAFSSTATNVVPGVGFAGDIYLHDRVAGTNLWVSVAMRAQLQAVTGQTNGVCFNHALSANGKFVAYQASPSALGSGTNTGLLLRYGVETGVTDLIHTNTTTAIPAHEKTESLDVTPDGGLVAFVANSNGLSGNTTCVQVWDASSGLTTLASGDLLEGVTTGTLSTRPLMDSTGRYVAFLSNGTNLVANPLTGDWHLYVRDTLTGTTMLATVDTNGAGSPVASTTAPTLSTDGRLVAFEAGDGKLIANDGNRSLDVFVRDLVAGTNELISARAAALPSAAPNGPSLLPSFASSADGRFIAFASEADDLVANDTNSVRDVFVRDLADDTVVLVSAEPGGLPADGFSSEPAISGNGRYVAFTSGATNLISGDTNGMTDIFVRDLQSGTIVLGSAGLTGGFGNSNSYAPTLSSDGRWLLFISQARNLVSDTITGPDNLYLRDLQLSNTVALTTGRVYDSTMTPDGRFIAFIGVRPGSSAPRLFIWDTLLGARVYTNTSAISYCSLSADGNLIAAVMLSELRMIDRAANTNWQVSPHSGPTRAQRRFSADGNWFVYPKYIAPWNQLFLYDIRTRTESQISRTLTGAAASGGHSQHPDISPDGRFVVYSTSATNIIAGMSGISRQVVLYDHKTGSNQLASVSRLTGLPANDHVLRAAFSPDGQTLLLQSWATDLAVADLSHSGDVVAQAILTAVILPPEAPDQGPWLYWPFVPGNNYEVQFKTNLSDPDWQRLPGSYTSIGVKAWQQDAWPTNSQRFYRIRSY